MSGLWEEYDQSYTGITTEGSNFAIEIFHNEVDDHIFASAPITIVDGIVTLYSDGVAFWKVRLGVFPELYVAQDIEDLPAHDSQWYYRWFHSGGPLVYRLRAKRTIPPEHKLWIYFEKRYNAVSANIYAGEMLYMVRHQ